MKKKDTKNKKGFTLIEVIVSIFIFAIMMTSISGIFARQISSYKQTRIMANDLENAQFALNYVAKTLRTSSIIGYGIGNGYTNLMDEIESGPNNTDDFFSKKLDPNASLIIYDFSQEACVKFTFKNAIPNKYAHPALWMESQSSVGIQDIQECVNPNTWSQNLGTLKDQRLTTGEVTGTFKIAPTRYQDVVGSRTTDTMGRATVSMKVVPSEFADNDHVEPVYIQSSTSL
ncbi:MAG: prepilin-type N-terminal cleavage/methylation domain-containing protein, partial [Patescibacteria group bacterium]|nr:prepilin-type N-terminal cleavage/methylation domain-containing protein [Patescibacteria group bacterium]